MRSWQRIAVGMLSPLIMLWWPGTALAQDGGDTFSILDDILVPLMTIIDGILTYWAEGNTLTDPLGENLAASLAQIVQELADFFAQMSLLL